MHPNPRLAPLLALGLALGCSKESPSHVEPQPSASSPPPAPPTASSSAPPHQELASSPPTTGRQVIGLHADQNFTFAIRADGRVLVWGDPKSLAGPELKSKQPTPVEVPMLESVKQMTTGSDHACAVHRDGTLSCWGRNFAGCLGDGTMTNRQRPTNVVDIPEVEEVQARGNQTCARTKEGRVYCWGSSPYADIVPGHSKGVNSKPLLADKLPPAVQVVMGSGTLAVHEDGSHNYWGWMIGVPCEYPRYDLCMVKGYAQVRGLENIRTIASSGHYCAVHTDGTVSCLGDGTKGQLGDGRFGEDYRQPRPGKVKGVGDIVEIGTGEAFTCAVRKEGKVLCWGDNTWGQIGSGNKKRQLQPFEVPGLSDVTKVALGRNHTCALRRNGSVYCWGNAQSGQTGSGAVGVGKADLTPVEVRLDNTQ